MRTLILLLLLAIPIQSQFTNARITALCGVSEGSGYENPQCGAEAGGSIKLDKVVIDGTVNSLFARKVPGGGHNIGAQATVRIPFKNIFIGPAFQFNQQTTSLYSKSAFGVGIEGGKHVNSAILSARFLQDLTSVNKVRTYEGRGEWYGGKRFGPYVSGRFGARDFDCIQGAVGLTKHCWSSHAVGVLGVWFR